MTAGPIGIIGGSGLYSLLSDAEDVTVDTPYGAPSDPLVVAEVAGRRLIFLPRHGRDHRFPPHRVPYRANLWALHSLGVRQVLAPCAVGALDRGLSPGALVVPDQLIDRTTARVSTFYDDGAVHVPFADPYCPRGRMAVVDVATRNDWRPVDGGTLAVVDGPRFSTRAESKWLAAAGATIINMTGQPEASLARELGLCYTALAVVTDLDAGIAAGETVTQDEVFAVFGRTVDRLRPLLTDVATALSDDRTCACSQALDGTAAEGRWA